ncbi:MAG: tRNA-cytidine(32) 2-sulfurtransferase [Eubacteriales bacterium SKADARSKE-1]|nr:tRNA-cytidine(32) 2-sulfurtransferase [Eubacteriales bacterium SKADARSKE-1]
MKKLISQVGSAIDHYNMINDGDNIAVCLSGGKDSTFLLYALNEIQKYHDKSFILKAITVDPCFNNSFTDFSKIEKLCDKLKIEYVIKRTNLAQIIFDIRKEKNPCSLCARMRRGILHDTAKENNCNKIALGHHFNDVNETFLLNLFNNGNISCFSPITYLSRKDIYMIRPLIYCTESKIIAAIKRNFLPVIKSTCPADGHTEREKIKNLISDLEKTYPNLSKKLFGAIQRSSISGW